MSFPAGTCSSRAACSPPSPRRGGRGSSGRRSTLSNSYRAVFDTMLPDVVPVADPFDVVRLADTAVDERRRRVQKGDAHPSGSQARPALPGSAAVDDRRRTASPTTAPSVSSGSSPPATPRAGSAPGFGMRLLLVRTIAHAASSRIASGIPARRIEAPIPLCFCSTQLAPSSPSEPLNSAAHRTDYALHFGYDATQERHERSSSAAWRLRPIEYPGLDHRPHRVEPDGRVAGVGGPVRQGVRCDSCR